MSVWDRYQPSSSAPWNLKRVVHLHRRVVFGACSAEIERDLKDDPQAAIARVLNGTCRMKGVPEDFEQLARIIGSSAVDSASPERLKAWWLYRCLYSPRPLEERLTLMWHNHFATSNLKVNDLRLMKQQNDSLRQRALSPFGDLLRGMSHDPALLEWLDAPSNRAGMPNENLARESMELFSLGIGNYSEHDVKEAARALTGWTVRQGQFRIIETNHDADSKTILNQSGNWTGDDFVRILLEQKSCARRLAWRLTTEFFGENVVNEAALDELADGLRDHDLNVGWAVEKILRSELFFSDENIQSRVADPVSFLLMPLRALECWREPPSTLVLAEWVTRMGQDLFYPPNVGGWTGGRAWLSTRGVVARANAMAAFVAGRFNSSARPLNLRSLAAQPDHANGIAEVVGYLSRVLPGHSDDLPHPRGSNESSDEPQLTAAVLSLLSGPQSHLH